MRQSMCRFKNNSDRQAALIPTKFTHIVVNNEILTGRHADCLARIHARAETYFTIRDFGWNRLAASPDIIADEIFRTCANSWRPNRCSRFAPGPIEKEFANVD
jgi:hypothetical protein